MRSPKPEPEPIPARIPGWADSYYPAAFRDVGRREPENRRAITVTPSAAAKIRASATGINAWYVRVRVEPIRDASGTPTGFKNSVDVVTDAYPEFDLFDDSQGVAVLVDRRSAEYLAGATLDWVEGTDGRPGFRLGKASR